MKRVDYIWIFTMLAGITFTSCIDERPFDREVDFETGKTAEISFLASTPPAHQVATRGKTRVTPENTIENIYVLVFDKTTEDLIAKSKGKDMNQDDNKVTFKATLPVETEYTFMVLANAEEKLNGIEVASFPAINKSDILDLTVSNTDKWDPTTAIPMWGEKALNLTASSTPSFELTRMLARVNVNVYLRDINGVPANNFRLTSVRYYNFNTNGALVPFSENYDFSENRTSYPTIPTAPGTQTGSALVYDGNEIENGMECNEKIYVFEAAHNNSTYNYPPNNDDWIENPCLVIGGIYTTPDETELGETFYRVDFIRKDEYTGDTWLSILRNFSYNVTIVEVSGSGFIDPDIALRSAPINMEANILVWEESDMNNIVFDGVFFLSVSRNKFSVVSSEVNEEKPENSLHIKTDYTFNNNPDHEESGWHVEKYVDKDTDDEVYWLTLNPDRAGPDADDPVKAYFTFEENDTGEPRTAIVWIAAGRLRYPVEVTQQLAWVSIVKPGTDIPLSELRFEVPVGGSPPETESFEVIWGPSTHPVGIEQKSPKEWAPFGPGYLNPDPEQMSWTLTGDGSKEFTVEAPEVSPSIIQQDPFYERESVYTFSIGTGDDAMSASITLHQIYYNIVVELYRYKLDGSTYNLSVRSNTEWVITNIEEWLYNKPPDDTEDEPVMLDLKDSDNLRIQTKGGPSLTGESVSFTVVDHAIDIHRHKWGTVYVIFESPDGKFSPKEIAIPFPGRSNTILGLSNALNVNAHNSCYASPYHNQGIHRMLAAEVNFGSLSTSTVKCEPFRFIGFNCEYEPRLGPELTPGSNWYRGVFGQWLNEYNPDIITIAWPVRFNSDDLKLLKQYLGNGGAVVMYYGGDIYENSHVMNMINGLLDLNTTLSDYLKVHHYAAVFKFENIDDPVLTGPFGDMRNLNFGSVDNKHFIRISALQNQVDVLVKYSTMQNFTKDNNYLEYAHAFRHKKLNLFWVGNSYGTGTGYYDETHYYYNVMRNSADFRPEAKTDFGIPEPRYTIHNPFMYLNAINWAMEVTNHKAPPGGYRYE